MQLAAVSDEIEHEVECLRVPINEDLAILFLERVAPGEQRFQGAALWVAEGRFSDTEIVLAADVQLHDIVDRLYLLDALQFFGPSVFLLLQLFSVIHEGLAIRPLFPFNRFFLTLQFSLKLRLLRPQLGELRLQIIKQRRLHLLNPLNLGGEGVLHPIEFVYNLVIVLF